MYFYHSGEFLSWKISSVLGVSVSDKQFSQNRLHKIIFKFRVLRLLWLALPETTASFASSEIRHCVIGFSIRIHFRTMGTLIYFDSTPSRYSNFRACDGIVPKISKFDWSNWFVRIYIKWCPHLKKNKYYLYAPKS